jgi:hypothetical protein
MDNAAPTVPAVSAMTSFVPRWIEELLARYNALGETALGDLRRHNGMRPSVLKRDLLEKLKIRLREPPPDGGVWSSRKVADFMAAELGLEKLAPQRGWEGAQARRLLALAAIYDGATRTRRRRSAALVCRSSGTGCYGSTRGAPKVCWTASRQDNHPNSMMASARRSPG